jgi:hypothetical protein
VIGETGWPSDGRMRADARPGRVEQVRYFSIFRQLAEKEHFDYSVVEAFDQYWKARQEGSVGAGLGPARRPARGQVRARPAGQRRAALAHAVRAVDHAVGLIVLAFASWRRRPPARSIAIFALFAQLVATSYVQATWIDLYAAPSISRRWSASPSGRCCSAPSATPCCAASPTA